MEISGWPVPLHPPPFSGVQNYKFNKLAILSAYHTNSLAHLRRALYMECTLVMRPLEFEALGQFAPLLVALSILTTSL